VSAGDIHPKNAKQLLARAIVATFNGYDFRITRAAENDFDSKFGKTSVLIPQSTKNLVVNSQQTLIRSGNRDQSQQRRTPPPREADRRPHA
jgi:hypothetical protein